MVSPVENSAHILVQIGVIGSIDELIKLSLPYLHRNISTTHAQKSFLHVSTPHEFHPQGVSLRMAPMECRNT